MARLLRAVCSLIVVLLGVAAGMGSELAVYSDYDYFLFVRQWGVSFCESGSCAIKPIERFSVHGLWPERRDGSWPSCCDGHYPFRIQNIARLIPELVHEWFSYTRGIKYQCRWNDDLETMLLNVTVGGTSRRMLEEQPAAVALVDQPSELVNDSPNYQFWRHEWEKHGTCSMDVFRNERDYFKTVLELQEKYELTAALAAQDIVPSKQPYRAKDIVHAIKKEFGVLPAISCRDGDIMEVRLCLSKDLEAFDCPGVGAANWGCDTDIYYPPASSHH